MGADRVSGVTPGPLLRDDPAAGAPRLSRDAGGPIRRAAAARSGGPGRRAATGGVQPLVHKRNAVYHPRAIHGGPHADPDHSSRGREPPGRGWVEQTGWRPCAVPAGMTATRVIASVTLNPLARSSDPFARKKLLDLNPRTAV